MLTRTAATLFTAILLTFSLHGDERPRPSAEKYSTKLGFSNGTYTSIFGLVPKKGELKLDEQRVIVVRPTDSGGFELEPISSTVQRTLSIPDELPTVENVTKPLTGKKVRVEPSGQDWKTEILSEAAPTPEEKVEADRLSARFRPDNAPFVGIQFDAQGKGNVDLGKLLLFLGYTEVREVMGSAEARLDLSRTSEKAPSSFEVKLQTAFSTGDGDRKISVDIDAQGTVSTPPNDPRPSTIKLGGKLGIHGHRDLPDGRRVPYSILTDFQYESVRETIATSGKAEES